MYEMVFRYDPIPMQNNEDNQSNMVIMEIELPSGYVTESDTLVKLANVYNIKKIETKNADTMYVVYFDNLEATKIVCPIIDAFRAHKVIQQKPVSISVYDYYDSGKFAKFHDFAFAKQITNGEFQKVNRQTDS